MKFLIINGPNLNMLGIREPEIYGKTTYQDLENYISEFAQKMSLDIEIFQSNHEGALIDKIQSAYQKVDGIVINPAAYTHTSIGILDALKAVGIPTVEVHLSDIYQRESFRHISYAGMACIKTFAGKGIEGYMLACEYLKETLEKR